MKDRACDLGHAKCRVACLQYALCQDIDTSFAMGILEDWFEAHEYVVQAVTVGKDFNTKLLTCRRARPGPKEQAIRLREVIAAAIEASVDLEGRERFVEMMRAWLAEESL